MNRLQQILIALLVVQIIIVAAIFWPQSGDTIQDAPLFGEISAQNVQALSVEDENGKTIHMARSDSGWVLPDADNYPVLTENVDPLLEGLIKVRTDRLVARTDASHKRLQVAVDDFLYKATLEFTDGHTETLIIGSTPSSGATHVRLEGQDEVYITSSINSWDYSASAANWVDPNYVTLPQENMTAMTLENANGTFDFKLVDGIWTMADLSEEQVFLPNNVISLLGQLSSVRLLEPLGKEALPAYGFDDPRAKITLTMENEETGSQSYTFLVGATFEDQDAGAFYFSGSEYYILINEFTVTNFVERDMEDFIQQEAEEVSTEE
ncbi:MAG: DUF4340 domain-containing protein [Anaerolineaceae bacterium]|nr:DUF4340 domain-containing protein [Anaerolineaceae bacterium]